MDMVGPSTAVQVRDFTLLCTYLILCNFKF